MARRRMDFPRLKGRGQATSRLHTASWRERRTLLPGVLITERSHVPVKSRFIVARWHQDVRAEALAHRRITAAVVGMQVGIDHPRQRPASERSLNQCNRLR